MRGLLAGETHALTTKPASRYSAASGGEIMSELLTPMHLTVVAIVAFALFGGKKLTEFGKGLNR